MPFPFWEKNCGKAAPGGAAVSRTEEQTEQVGTGRRDISCEPAPTTSTRPSAADTLSCNGTGALSGSWCVLAVTCPRSDHKMQGQSELSQQSDVSDIQVQHHFPATSVTDWDKTHLHHRQCVKRPPGTPSSTHR